MLLLIEQHWLIMCTSIGSVMKCVYKFVMCTIVIMTLCIVQCHCIFCEASVHWQQWANVYQRDCVKLWAILDNVKMRKWENGTTGENIMILSLSQDIWPDSCESDCHFKVRLKMLALYKLRVNIIWFLFRIQDLSPSYRAAWFLLYLSSQPAVTCQARKTSVYSYHI